MDLATTDPAPMIDPPPITTPGQYFRSHADPHIVLNDDTSDERRLSAHGDVQLFGAVVNAGKLTPPPIRQWLLW